MPHTERQLKIANSLRALFESGFPKDILGESILSGYEWIKLVQEQTGLNFQDATDLAFQVAPEFTAEYWEEQLNVQTTTGGTKPNEESGSLVSEP